MTTPLMRAQLARERAELRKEQQKTEPSEADVRAWSMNGEIRRRHRDPNGLLRNHSRKRGAKDNWRTRGPVGEVTTTFVDPAILRQDLDEESGPTDTAVSDDTTGSKDA